MKTLLLVIALMGATLAYAEDMEMSAPETKVAATVPAMTQDGTKTPCCGDNACQKKCEAAGKTKCGE